MEVVDDPLASWRGIIEDIKQELKDTITEREWCTQIKNLLDRAPHLKNLLDRAPHIAAEDEEGRYNTEAELEIGAYGTILGVRDRVSGEVCAMKVLNLNGGVIEPSVSREMSIMFDINHENIVRLERVFICGMSICLIMEELEINLVAFLQLHGLDEKAIKTCLKQILSAVAYLHSGNIMHRDLKPENVLVDNLKNLKLADFGLARGWFNDISLTPQVTTLQFRAPELLLGSESYTSAIDLWSIGCIFAKMATSKPLFGGEGISLNMMIELVFKKFGTPPEETWPEVTALPNFPHDLPTFTPEALEIPSISATGNDLLRRLLCMNPKERITAKDALEHPYLVVYRGEGSQLRIRRKKKPFFNGVIYVCFLT